MSMASKKYTSSRVKTPGLGIDVILLLATVTLIVFGLLMVYSASVDISYQYFESSTYLITRQISALGIGVFIAVLLTHLNYHIWEKLALFSLIGTVALLLIVFITNEVRLGATRTIFGGSYQPAELGKLVTIIYLSVWLFSKRDKLHEVGFGLLPLSLILGVIAGLILRQPDLSAAATIILLGGTLFFLAGGDMKQITILVLAALVIGAVVVWANPTGNERMDTYVPGLVNPLDSNYHVLRSLEAFVKGGFLGVGIGRGTTKLIGLPIPHSDSIFAVVGEETGLVGAVILVALYGLILWRGMVISSKAPDGLGKLLAAGLSIWIVMEAVFNMSGIVGLLPFAGNALPFISAGGSNLVISLAAIGILMNISKVANKADSKAKVPNHATVNLRWRNRGRGLSRPRSSKRT